MSQSFIDELLRSAAGDGGSLPINAKPYRMDFDDLLNAWSIERSHSIECEMLLNLSRAIIARLMATDTNQVVAADQDTTDLIHQIDDRLRNRPTNRA